MASASTPQGKAAYAYDADRNLVTASLPGGASHHYSYVAGQLSSYSEDLGGHAWQRPQTTTIGRNAAGQVTSETTGGRTSSYTYDPAGQLSSETLPVGFGAKVTVTYTYDANGNRASATIGTGRGEDWRGNGGREQDALAPAVGQGASTRGSNGQGDAERAGPGKLTVARATYTYDAANELSALSLSGPSGRSLGAESYTYDAAGRQVLQSGPTGSLSTSYDARGLATSLVATSASGHQAWSQRRTKARRRTLSAPRRRAPTGEPAAKASYGRRRPWNRCCRSPVPGQKGGARPAPTWSTGRRWTSPWRGQGRCPSPTMPTAMSPRPRGPRAS